MGSIAGWKIGSVKKLASGTAMVSSWVFLLQSRSPYTEHPENAT